MHWKDFLYFQRGSKTAVILILILIVMTLILNVFLSNRKSSGEMIMQNDSLSREFDEFRHSLTLKESSENASVRRDRFVGDGSRSVYRSSNSTNSTQRDNSPQSEHYAYQNREKSSYSVVEKLSPGETISLNETDTAEWKRIPGIGSAFSSRIVKYRNLLGGFTTTEQLLEVYGIEQELFSQIVVYIKNDGNYNKLHVNQSDFKELLRHPYLNYKQVQSIMSIRRKKGAINSIRELSILDEFTPEDILRLEPYLEF